MAPKNAKMDDGIAIIAGRGSLPIELANGAVDAGKVPFLVGIKGEAGQDIEAFDHEFLAWGQIGRMFKLLKARNITKAIFAGGVRRPTRITQFKLDWMGLVSAPKIFNLMRNGDNTLLSGLAEFFEQHGVEIVGAHDVVPKLVTTEGVIAGSKPTRQQKANISKAFKACKQIGELDIGQAAIAEQGNVVAEENIEGTDAMIERVARMRSQGKLPENGKDGVLVKAMKPGQDMRVDLPAIGPDTITRVARAGLRGIALEAGHTLILSRKETLKTADTENIFIYGLEPETGAAST